MCRFKLRFPLETEEGAILPCQVGALKGDDLFFICFLLISPLLWIQDFYYNPHTIGEGGRMKTKGGGDHPLRPE